MEGEKGTTAVDGEGGGGAERGKDGSLGLKLTGGICVSKKGGHCTPVPSWKLDEEEPIARSEEAIVAAAEPRRSSVSARKLGASLWEMEELVGASSSMSPEGGMFARRRRDRKAIDRVPRQSAIGHDEGPLSAGSLRRHVAASMTNHYKLKESDCEGLRVESPASCSTMEVIGTFNQAMTPSSSVDLKGKLRECGYNLKTSTELVKVLNRIWSLEEQQTSNISLVKALKVELGHARGRIQELMLEQHAYRHEMDELLKKVHENRLNRKIKEQHKVKSMVQSIRDELEDERHLRRHSESLHRKMAKELSEVKAAYTGAVKELERERKTNGLLEDLCDEFANSIKDYEQEVRVLKQKTKEDCDSKADRRILHLAEAWLDERIQMKVAEGRGDLTEKSIFAERLNNEIESFLEARRSNVDRCDFVHQKDEKIANDRQHLSRESIPIDCNMRRQSLESVHLNGTASAPQDAEDEDSIASDLRCFELNMATDIQSKPNNQGGTGELDPASTSTFPITLQYKMDESKLHGRHLQHSDRAQGLHLNSHFDSPGAAANQSEILFPRKSENSYAENGDQEARLKWTRMHDSKCHESENCNNYHGEEPHDHSTFRGQFVLFSNGNASQNFGHASSPAQQWKYGEPLDLNVTESLSKATQGVKGHTLKARLLEARLEGQHARRSLKASSSMMF